MRKNSRVKILQNDNVNLVSRSQTPPLFDIWTAGRESGALTLKLSFRELPEVGSGY